MFYKPTRVVVKKNGKKTPVILGKRKKVAKKPPKRGLVSRMYSPSLPVAYSSSKDSSDRSSVGSRFYVIDSNRKYAMFFGIGIGALFLLIIILSVVLVLRHFDKTKPKTGSINIIYGKHYDDDADDDAIEGYDSDVKGAAAVYDSLNVADEYYIDEQGRKKRKKIGSSGY